MKQASLVAEEPTALDRAKVSGGDAQVLLFERLATDQNVSVEKIERLMALWERGEARKSEGIFYAAMSDAQQKMRPVAADATNPQTRSKYASYGAIDDKLRPIYTEHGFGLSFNTGDSPVAEHVRVLCLVTHRGGHSREYHIDMPADGKGAKGGDVMTKTHAVGSAVSYGMRYLLKMIFNVAIGEFDDDGNAAGRTATTDRQVQRKPPDDKYDAWFQDMEAVALTGLGALQEAWKQSRSDYRRYLTETDGQTWEKLKAKAAQVKAVTA